MAEDCLERDQQEALVAGYMVPRPKHALWPQGTV